MKRNLYVLYGGKSMEHEVSIISATSVLNATDKEKYNVYPVFITKEGKWCLFGKLDRKIEQSSELELETELSVTESLGEFIKSIDTNKENIVFPVLHGNNGEDGTVQGLFELIDIPYVGNEVLSSAAGMDKVIMSDILSSHDIPLPKYTSINSFQWNNDKENVVEVVLENVNLPCYVKPANSGSSVGISKATTKEELIESMKLSFIYDTKILIQEEVIGREIQTCIIGNDEPRASVSGELIMEDTFYDYETKYINNTTIPVIPARLNDDVRDNLREIALKSYKALDCRGIVRIDIFVTDENEILVNEINTLPGFTPISMAPVLWEKTDGTTYPQLVEILINYGLERYAQKKTLSSIKITK